MKLEGTFTVRAPRERVWAFFTDPHALASCIDDPHELYVMDENRFRGTIKAGVGFIKGTFTGSAMLTALVPPERGRIKARGSGMGSAFDVDSVIEMSESGEFNEFTTVRWEANVILSGTIASVGARVVQGTIDEKTRAFFDNVRKRLETG